MAEPTGNPGTPPAGTPAPAAPATPAAASGTGGTEDTLPSDPLVLQEMLRKLRGENAARRVESKTEREARERAETELTTLRTADAKRREDELKAQGQYQKLAEEAQAKAAKLEVDLASEKAVAEKYRASLTSDLTALKAQLGDETVKGMAGLDTLPLETQVATLRAISAFKSGTQAAIPPVVTTPPANRVGPNAAPPGSKVDPVVALMNRPGMTAGARMAALRKLEAAKTS